MNLVQKQVEKQVILLGTLKGLKENNANCWSVSLAVLMPHHSASFVIPSQEESFYPQQNL